MDGQGTVSLLYRPGDRPLVRDAEHVAREAASDLGLDRIAAALQEARDIDAAVVASFLEDRLRDEDAVAYRHEVFGDLGRLPGLADALSAFLAAIGVVRGDLARAAVIRHPHERHRWLLAAAAGYRDAVVSLVGTLDGAGIASRALHAVREALRAYRASDAFTSLDADATRALEALDQVRYRLRIGENRVTVSPADDAPDFGEAVARTFAPFGQSGAPPLRVDVFETADMSSIEAEILARVVRLHPDAFRALDAFASRHATFVDPLVGQLVAEAAIYLGWRDLVQRLRDAGRSVCYPVVTTGSTAMSVSGVYDLVLALDSPDGPLVPNDVEATATEWLLVLTGANQGGKTTLARAIGQVHQLASIGCPVPAAAAVVPLVDLLRTHFDRGEDPSDGTGRLESDLLRLREVLAGLTPNSLVILNETFASTTTDDALELNRAVLDVVRGAGARCVAVTFLGELASFDEGTVSLTMASSPDAPTRPSYRAIRRPADDVARANSIADAYGLGYAAVRERLAR